MNEHIIGVAKEDSYISAGLVDFETRKVVKNSLQRKKVDPYSSADDIISAWAKVLNDVSQLNLTANKQIGISLPGICDYNTGVLSWVTADRYNSLYGSNLKELLASQLGIGASDIRMVNDAACFLQGEIFGGAGRGFKRSLGVTLGIGLGNARYNNGIVEDTQLYNMPLYDGIAEDFICVKWIINRYKMLSGVQVRDLIELKQLAAGDQRVLQVFDEFAENLSLFLTSFIRQNNPEIVVIGGFMESFNRFFFDTLTEKMLKIGIKIPILRAILGEQASVIGAASTWYESSPLHA